MIDIYQKLGKNNKNKKKKRKEIIIKKYFLKCLLFLNYY